MINQDRNCRWCGVPVTVVGHMEKHHLFRRSTHPRLIKDPKNLVDLCSRCHRRATNNRKFEEELQICFYRDMWEKYHSPAEKASAGYERSNEHQSPPKEVNSSQGE